MKLFEELIKSLKVPIYSNIDHLWHTAGMFHTSLKPRPNWNGFMHDVTSKEETSSVPVSTIKMLPIIDFKPTDPTCIYSTLPFVIDQATKLGIDTPSITFDQQLWIIALEIVLEKSLKILILLGGFHKIMSFFGSIGTIMDGSGISTMFQTIYGENATKHILSGKATARATRAHILAECALLIKLQEVVLNDSDNAIDIDAIKNLYESVVSIKQINAVSSSPALESLVNAIEEKKSILANKSRTAKLWINYIKYIQVCRNFIWASRTGDWHLHLHSASQMMNLFAATGHHNYGKSTRVY